MVGNLLNHDNSVLISKPELVLYSNKIFFYLLFGFVEYFLHKKIDNLLENMRWMSTDERRRARGILQAGCCIRAARFWKCSKLLLMNQCLWEVVSFMNSFKYLFSMLYSCIVTIRSSLICIGVPSDQKRCLLSWTTLGQSDNYLHFPILYSLGWSNIVFTRKVSKSDRKSNF
jgi:hypothetical protein